MTLQMIMMAFRRETSLCDSLKWPDKATGVWSIRTITKCFSAVTAVFQKQLCQLPSVTTNHLEMAVIQVRL